MCKNGSDGEKKSAINTNNFLGSSREQVGLKFAYVLLCSWGTRETQNKIARKSQENAGTVPGQSRDNPMKCFLHVFSC